MRRALPTLLAVLACRGQPAGSPDAAAPPATAKTPEEIGNTTPVVGRRIVRGSGVRLRAEPSGLAPPILRLGIGSILELRARTSRQEMVGGKSDHWYHVRTATGAEGWIFGALTLPYEEAGAVEQLQQIARERVVVADAPFEDLADLVSMFDRSLEAETDRGRRAALTLERFRVLGRTAETFPQDKAVEPRYKKWIERHDADLVYSEPGGIWMIRAPLLWELEKSVHDLPIADEIAWAAASAPLPGECEGYLGCALASINACEGEYLERHPTGVHTREALKAIAEQMEYLRQGEVDSGEPDSIREVKTELAKLRERLKKQRGKKAAAIGKELAKIEKRVR